MKILSIHAQSHDTSIALIENDKVLYASSNERFSRIKMDSGFPILALNNCLKFTKTDLNLIDEVVMVSDPFPQDYTKTFLSYTQNTILGIWFYLTNINPKSFIWSIRHPRDLLNLIPFFGIPRYFYTIISSKLRVKRLLKDFRGKYTYIHHHFAHLYSAYYGSGWDRCLVACFEGDGLSETTSIYKVEDNQWIKLMEAKMPHSFGVFYIIPTLLLGFKPIKHAGKITGLAGFGDPNKVYKYVKKLLWIEKGTLKVDYLTYYKWYVRYSIYKVLPGIFQGVKREDIAAAFQKRLEECVIELIKNALRETGISKVALAGGVVANVKMNQKIQQLKGISEIYIHPGMGDEGIALGAGLHAAFKAGHKVKLPDNVYFGPQYSDQEIEKTLGKNKLSFKKYRGIEKRVAQLLSSGQVVARFNGRMEYGPRALGNRSILYQGTDPSVNKWLNDRLKRSEFMPFAPVTLDKFADKCYLNLEGAITPAKFMTITFDCTDFMKRKTPAAVHIDGTARPQIITRWDNPSYYKILEEYYKITKIPSIINTSFNMHEEPIVCTPEDAVRAFVLGGIDYLVIGNFLVENKNVT